MLIRVFSFYRDHGAAARDWEKRIGGEQRMPSEHVKSSLHGGAAKVASMSTLAAAIFAAMLHLQCPADEPAAECQPWRAQVAEAIATAAEEATCTSEWAKPDCKPTWPGPPDELAAVLLEIAFHESGLRKRIQAGDYHEDEGDPIKSQSKTIGHRARSLWQMHASPTIPGVVGLVPRSEWQRMNAATPEALLLSARAATRLLVKGRTACGSTGGALMFYGMQSGCLGGNGKRGLAVGRLLKRMRASEAAKK